MTAGSSLQWSPVLAAGDSDRAHTNDDFIVSARTTQAPEMPRGGGNLNGQFLPQ